MDRFSRRRVLALGAAAGVAVLAGATPVLASAGDSAPATTDPAGLRAAVLAGSPAHIGYAESVGRLGLPEIPQLERVTALLSDTTRLRSYVAAPDRMRVDELTPAGERDLYVVGGREYLWDFGLNQLVSYVGQAPLRLPRAADLTPPELGRRLVRLTAADPVEALRGARIAGLDAAGFRVTPADPQSTVGRIDVWTDPASGLVLRVAVGAAGGGPDLLITAFTDVVLRPPDAHALRPSALPGAGSVIADAVDLAGALRQLDAAPAPDRLAGRARVPLGDGLPGVGVYGSGVAGFVLVPASRGIADRVIDGAAAAGGVPVDAGAGRAVRFTTPLLTLLARSTGGRRGGALLAGTVVPEVLERAVRELPTRRRT